jgi:hypothetical protein
MINGNTSSAAPKTEECALQQMGNDRSSHWHQAAATLSRENAELVCRLSRYEEQINRHREALKRLSHAKLATESDLAAANREIMRLTVCANSIVLPTAAPIRLQSIPVNLQGRDGHYWYQTCRTMEAQFIQKTAELQAVIDTLIEAAAANQHRGS